MHRIWDLYVDSFRKKNLQPMHMFRILIISKTVDFIVGGLALKEKMTKISEKVNQKTQEHSGPCGNQEAE